jgi:methylenetetrahydrofolate dehydrogenase (NADP+)/methenyltetrahydrofolate cyclohydrolase
MMDGRALAERIRAEVAADVAELGRLGLATVLVGDDPASEVYIRLKHEAARAAGIETIDHRLAAATGEEEVLELVAALNADEAVHALLVQLPLPAHIDEARVTAAVDPVKDVDGLHPVNAGRLFFGRPGHVGATPLGIMRLLAEYDVSLAGARAVVIGRSAIVGKPAALLLLQQHATVTVCHSYTADLASVVREADVVVAAVGKAHLVTPDMVKPGAAVIDVGINRTAEGLTGDVHPGVADVAGHLTPVPGGVGPMTIAMLLAGTVRAATLRQDPLAAGAPRG